MDQAFDIVCLGDATIDIFLHLSDDQNISDFNFQSGEKYLADAYKISTGGIASNIAVGLSKLGKETAIIAEIGTDDISQKIIQNFKQAGVLTNLIKTTPQRNPTLSAIISSKGKHVIFTAHVLSEHEFSFENIQSDWMVIASLGEKWKDAYDKALSFAKSRGVKIAFVPGKNQLKEGREYLSNILKSCEVIILNKEEAKMLAGDLPLGRQEADDIKFLLEELKKNGPNIVVITEGLSGSYSIDQDSSILHAEALKVNTIETTGAGDSYASGFLAGFSSGESIENSMKWGAINSSSVVQKVGAQQGLLERESLNDKLSESDLIVEKI